MKVVVFGATGTAGQGAIEACLAAPDVSEVRAVTRRPLGRSRDRLVEVTCSNFADLTDIAQHLSGLATCLFCLGTSARNVSGEDQYRQIHVTYALTAARALFSQSPEASFMYLSGAGTHRASRMMWARVKAEAEDQLLGSGLGSRAARSRGAGVLSVASPKPSSRSEVANRAAH